MNNNQANKVILTQLSEKLNPPSNLPQNATKYYSVVIGKLSKLWNFLNDIVIKIGRAQLLRKHIASELNVNITIFGNN